MKNAKIFIVAILSILCTLLVVRIYNKFFYHGELVVIKGTNIYHKDNCQFVKKASSNSLVFLKDIEEAAKHNLRPCNTCKPPYNKKIFNEVTKKEQEKNSFTYLNDEPKGDISKVVVAGDTYENDGYAIRITGTVKNDDTVQHRIYIQVVFYDKNNKPVSTQETSIINIEPGKIEGFGITQSVYVGKIKNYTLKVIQSKYDI